MTAMEGRPPSGLRYVLTAVLVGAPLGVFCGPIWISCAMSLAGGGNSHSDVFLVLLSGGVGALLGPIVVALLRTLFGGGSRDPARRHGRDAIERIFLVTAAALAAFVATSFWYHATHIAELPPEHGGPVSELSGEVRRLRASWGAAGALVTSVSLMALAVRARFSRRARSAP